jgi:1-acyl-sn-glycerol-3-phosphate acyltransferase
LKLRGYATVVSVCLGLLAADLFQRLVITPLVWLRPERRIPILGRWMHAVAWYVTTCAVRIGGAKIPVPERVVPAEPGHLILMNHQSLLDIPLVVRTVDGGAPRIVTRQRYSRFIPLISHMVKLYQYPVVDPSANRGELKRTLDYLEEVGRTSDVPIAVFPEGTRTRNGEIGRFKQGGLVRLLAARPWTVHIFVADGFWQAPTLVGSAGGVGEIRGTFACAGELRWEDPGADPGPFIQEARRVMVEGLAALRGERAPV